ncbi:hypothetical protein [Bacillus sp. FJAT-52991]|uniref:Uncharacterized protein n=1 Tax=Bacillus kandeliae TaxID=3129297 RepID=A0ABZ2N783_9BACI
MKEVVYKKYIVLYNILYKEQLVERIINKGEIKEEVLYIRINIWPIEEQALLKGVFFYTPIVHY